MKKNMLLLLFIIVAVNNAVAQGRRGLVGDLNYGGVGVGLKITEIVAAAGSNVYIAGKDEVYGAELWKSDGTTAGSVLVTDLWAGSAGSSPKSLTYANGNVYFFALDEATNLPFLYKSNGTSAGTVKITRISQDTFTSTQKKIYNFSGIIYFAGWDSTNGTELWKTDGTTAGTVIVKNIGTGSSDSGPSNFLEIGANLYFAATGPDGTEVYKSNGTDAGTVIVSSTTDLDISSLRNVNGTLYFATTTGIFKSNGTPAGTVLVKGGFTSLKNFTAVGSQLYFLAYTGTPKEEIWKSDGTSAGTVLVKDITGSNPKLFYAFNNALYFIAWDAAHGDELWRSDGTAAGTGLLFDINYGVGEGPGIEEFETVGNKFYFGVYTRVDVDDNPQSGNQLWESDGTAAGTKVVAPWLQSAKPSLLTNANGTLYFMADTGNGFQLYKSDLTEAGTIAVSNISLPGSYVRNITNVNNVAYFSADDQSVGRELWRSTVNEALPFTAVVKRINPTSQGSNPEQLTNVNGTLFFVATDGTHGYELWKSDGTDAGTVMVKDIISGNNESRIKGMINVNGTLFFAIFNTPNVLQLWKSNGTSGGTVLIRSFPNTASFSPASMGSNLYFGAYDGTNSIELWKSNGTASGTTIVKNINSSNGDYIYHTLVTAKNNLIYFVSNSNSENAALWQSNGTNAGTVKVKDFYPGEPANFSKLIHVNGLVYFSVIKYPYTDEELWKSNGTLAGTVKMRTFPGFNEDEATITNFKNVNGKLFFTPQDNAIGKELWRSSGSVAGTALVKEIRPGGLGSLISTTAVLNNILYFQANDGVHGNEIWRSDGTNSGTYMVYDMNPTGGSLIHEIVTVGNLILISADNGQYGSELYYYQPCANCRIADENAVSTVNIENESDFLEDGGCTIIASLKQPEAQASTREIPDSSAVNGIVSAKVWLETAVPADYVKRHYEITGEDNTAPANGKLTLYFSAEDFAGYNAVNENKLPVDGADKEGYKANLLIQRYAGTSSDGSGLPSSYTSAVEVLDPDDKDIVWNNNRWEVSFEMKGFSGFFVSARNTEKFANTAFSIYPNPVSEFLTVKSLKPMDKITLLGQNGTQLKSYNVPERQQEFIVRVAELPAGIYMIRIESGDKREVLKFVK